MMETGIQNDMMVANYGSIILPSPFKKHICFSLYSKEEELCHESNRNNILKFSRIKKNLKIRELAEATGIRASVISEYEKKKRKLSYKMAKRIAAVLEIDPILICDE